MPFAGWAIATQPRRPAARRRGRRRRSRLAPAAAARHPAHLVNSLTRPSLSTPTQTVLGIILGGGAGSRLYPLTKKRAKPAVPLGANYRLIDIPVSNCINSGAIGNGFGS